MFMTRRRNLAYLSLVITSIIWGNTIAVAKNTFTALTPAEFLYLRYLLASLLSFPYLIYLLYKLRPRLQTLSKIALLEVIATPLPLLLLYEGVNRTSAIESSLITATSPIFTVLGGIIFLKERETKREWRGLALSFLGTIILVAEPLFAGNGSLSYSLSGNFLVLTYNLLWTAYCLLAKRLYRSTPKTLVSALAYPLYAIFFLFYLLVSDNHLPSLFLILQDFSLSLSFLYLAIFSSFIAGTLYIYGQSQIEASEASVFTYLQGVIAIPATFLILGEKPTPISLIAVLIISFGVYLAESRPTKKSRPTR